MESTLQRKNIDLCVDLDTDLGAKPLRNLIVRIFFH